VKKKQRVAIVKNLSGKHKSYINACGDLGIECDVIDVFNSDPTWMDKLKTQAYDRMFVVPPCDSTETKLLFNDLIGLAVELGQNVYPSPGALFLYENKRLLSYQLKRHSIPAPRTFEVNSKSEFNKIADFLGHHYVFKSIVGSGSSSVLIVKSKSHSRAISRKVFGFHPAIAFGLLPKKKKLGFPIPVFGRSIKHACVIQELCEFVTEWRVIIIGIYCMAFRKEKGDNGFASGSGRFRFGLPPESLINFAVKVSKILKVDSAAFDIFEKPDGEYLVNEVQCNFGCRVKSQAYPNATMFDENGKPCLLVLINNNSRIVYGEYAHNACHNLKVAHALSIDIL
jgi:glutathione synthase/RimK-type ligase-like ATP-grasp enzyme